MADSTEEKPVTSSPIIGEDGKPLSKSALKKLEKEKEKERKRLETEKRLAAEKAAREAASPDYSKDSYGKLPVNKSTTQGTRKGNKISEIPTYNDGFDFNGTCRIQTSRSVGGKKVFITLRQGFQTVQGVLTVDDTKVSKQMVKYASSINVESLVLIDAKVVKALQSVKSCTISEFELAIEKIFVISEAARLPFSLEDASRPETAFDEDPSLVRVNIDTRLNNRVVDLRTITNHAIFQLQSAICQLFRNFLIERDFMEIHTPKLLGSASESGSSVFEVKYFKERAFLAQSPQFYKQMLICGDFRKVFEIGPVFRAENSQTHRHMTEFTGLDLEMAFEENYHEVLYTIADMFTYIFKNLQTKYAKQIEVVRQQYPFPDFEFLEKPLVLQYKEGVRLLREAGVEMGDYEDLTTENERKLGQIVKDKYHTDFYVLDKFPLAVRPFYTMDDPTNPGYSNSYDFFMRGEEIMSGAQRVHDPEYLIERCKAHGLDVSTITGYVDAFKYGTYPHAGGGIGLERVLMLYLNLGNIRKASLFPRDPKRLEP